MAETDIVISREKFQQIMRGLAEVSARISFDVAASALDVYLSVLDTVTVDGVSDETRQAIAVTLRELAEVGREQVRRLREMSGQVTGG